MWQKLLRKNRWSGGAESGTSMQRPQIAVHLHLFYTDLLEEFLNYFQNIPEPFDLYISCVKGADTQMIQRRAQERLKQLNRVEVRIVKNRGRDIAPFYVTFGMELSRYQYLLHVHSKKSKHIAAGGGDWRVYSLDSLLGSRELTGDILRRFKDEPDVGLIYPDWHPDIPMIGYTWMANGAQGRMLLERMGIPYREGVFFYPTGSFFWARVDAVRPLFEVGLRLRDFPREKGQIDGTLAHVLERAITFVAAGCGYHSCIVDTAEHVMKRDRTLKPFEAYLNMSGDEALEELKKYTSVSFGVFGTLLDVVSYRPQDIIRMTAQRLSLPEPFTEQRIEAEQYAAGRYGAAMDMDRIYDELYAMSAYDKQELEKIKETERNCLLEMALPREDMPEIVRELVASGVQVSVVCDSYYPRETIEALLAQCGYTGYHKLWVSCEHGVSKRDEQLWNLVYGEYDPAHHIHVGSDVYGDWYTLERRGTRSMYVMSARQAYELSAVYREPSSGMSLQESVDLGRKVKQEWFPSPFGLAMRDGMY